jgi:DNA-binding winged helix-turn-helix (wHTH) protein
VKEAVVHIRFGPCLLDLDARQLRRDNHVRHLSPKAFALLAALVEARPRVLTKVELHERLWPDAFVVDANLSNLVAELRAAIGDDAAAPRFVRTAHRIGYAFDAAAVVVQAPAARHSPAAGRWIEWGRQRFPLSDGVHVWAATPMPTCASMPPPCRATTRASSSRPRKWSSRTWRARTAHPR